MRVVSTPTYIVTDHLDPLYGVLTGPDDGVVGGAVLICAPVGKEYNHTVRGFKRLAEQLAAQGLLVLRFDYAGTGESGGAQNDPQAVRSWDESITAAMAFLREQCEGSVGIAVIGHRTGALLAMANDAVRTSATSVVLWDPVVSGGFFVKTQQMLYQVVSQGPAYIAPGHENTTELAGLSLHRDAAKKLSRMMLDHNVIAGERIFALLGDDEMNPTLPDEISAAGGTVRRIGDQGAFINAVDPWFTHYPNEIAHIVDWVAAGFTPSTARWRPEVTDAAVLGFAADGHPLETRVRTTSYGLVVWDTARLGEHESADRILVSHPVGHDVRGGPTRLYHELAGEVAARHGRMIRFDRRGLGETGTTKHTDTFLPLFNRSYAREGKRIVDDLDLSSASVIAHVGICIGSWMSAHAAMTTARRSGSATRSVAVIVNPNRWDLRPALDIPTPPGRHGHERRSLIERQRQRLIAFIARQAVPLSGRVTAPRLRSVLSRSRVFQMPDVMLDAVVGTGADVRLVFGPKDHELFESLGGAAALRRRGLSVPIRSSETGDHSGYHCAIHEIVRADCLAALGLSDDETTGSQTADTDATDTPTTQPGKPMPPGHHEFPVVGTGRNSYEVGAVHLPVAKNSSSTDVGPARSKPLASSQESS